MKKYDFDLATLLETAFSYREKAYTPYSSFSVGAALLTEEGVIFGGCNIENAAYSPTLCAERAAFAKAISEGHRSFSALVVVGGTQGEDPTDFVPPCGVCRQWLVEFCSADMPVFLAKSREEYQVHTCAELMPHSFSSHML